MDIKALIELFHYQQANNPVYRKYCESLKIRPEAVSEVKQIPFLPIEFFKSQQVLCGKPGDYAAIFTSSGTGGEQSRHYVKDLSIYEKTFLFDFRHFYGDPKDWIILALLPSYLEREGSSLVYMVDKLIRESGDARSRFYLNEKKELKKVLEEAGSGNKKALLIGVTYALLDFADEFPMKLNNVVVMETGGMKGKRKEIVREEVHAILKEAFGQSAIHSEYGMTEMLSQAYSQGNGIFYPSPTMTVLIRDINDPLSYLPSGRTGGINVIDTANIHSCSFIATQDLGKLHADGSFEVLGRFDNSDVRGCNLLVVSE